MLALNLKSTCLSFLSIGITGLASLRELWRNLSLVLKRLSLLQDYKRISPLKKKKKKRELWRRIPGLKDKYI
jgi:hypothetical protein